MNNKTDDQLIALLKLNGRESVSSLARKMGVSRTTIQDRIKRLENAGTIAGYSVRLGEVAKKNTIDAFVEVTVEPRHLPTILHELYSVSAINVIHTVSGKFDLVVLLSEQSTHDVDNVLDRIGQINGITKTSSAIVLSTKLDRR